MRTIYSREHLLAKDVSEAFHEEKKFAMYLGVIKRVGFDIAFRIFSEIKQSRKVITPAKLFMWMSSEKALMDKKLKTNGRNNKNSK